MKTPPLIALIGLGFALALLTGCEKAEVNQDNPSSPPGMVWIPGGSFLMGSLDSDPMARSVEMPAHPVKVDGFWMDIVEVTNTEFAKFVEATGYVTEAERKPRWEDLKKQVPPGTPRPPDDKLIAGSMVFDPPGIPVPLNNHAAWWTWTPGANWRHPEGPESNLEGLDDHPVVQVSWDDAVKYCEWAGKRLPSEAEWEFAARGGLESNSYTWGNESFSEKEAPPANIWQGSFPNENSKNDGYGRTAPTKSYPPNGYGLHDMSGNVWEWCQDWWRVDLYRHRAGKGELVVNPKGPPKYFDPRHPYESQRVTRGGSFLCHDRYCSAYRPAGRRGTAQDTGMSHIGFRCVMTKEVSESR